MFTTAVFSHGLTQTVSSDCKGTFQKGCGKFPEQEYLHSQIKPLQNSVECLDFSACLKAVQDSSRKFSRDTMIHLFYNVFSEVGRFSNFCTFIVEKQQYNVSFYSSFQCSDVSGSPLQVPTPQWVLRLDYWIGNWIFFRVRIYFLETCGMDWLLARISCFFVINHLIGRSLHHGLWRFNVPWDQEQ